MTNFPPVFCERLQQIYPTEWETVLSQLKQPTFIGLRLNTLVASSEIIQQALQTSGLSFMPVSWLPDAYLLPQTERDALVHSTLVKDGLIYIQTLSSQLPPLVLTPQDDEHILDLAAAPGSKTSQLAMLMHNTGRIAAVEYVKARYFKLNANLTQLGVANTRTYWKDGAQVWRHCPQQFDRVLVDAPCSSEARFQASVPDSYAYWSPQKIKEMVRKQKQLLYSGLQCLKPGGTLVYSTCTFSPEENEGVVHHVLQKFGDEVSIEPIGYAGSNGRAGLTQWDNKVFDARLAQALRLLPTDEMEAFFICKLKKR